MGAERNLKMFSNCDNFKWRKKKNGKLRIFHTYMRLTRQILCVNGSPVTIYNVMCERRGKKENGEPGDLTRHVQLHSASANGCVQLGAKQRDTTNCRTVDCN